MDPEAEEENPGFTWKQDCKAIKIFGDQEFSEDGKSISGDNIIGITETGLPAAGPEGIWKLKLRVPMLVKESIIGLVSLSPIP